VEFVGFEQTDGDHVISRVRLSDGNEECVRSRYLIGCDGARSAVRHAVGLPFEGTDHDSVVFLADVKLEGEEFVKSRITNFTSRRGFVSVLPFLGEYSRIFAVDFAKQHRAQGEGLTFAELQDTVDAIVPMKLTMREPRWLTRFCSPSRQVPTNRVGRVILAGDASHAHSPAGGQGMNTGLQDAFNLAWKLAMVLRDEAPEKLLASYDAERHPVDARIQRETDMMLRSFLLRNPVLAAARDLAARTLVPLRPVQRLLAGDLSGIGVNYRFTGGPARTGGAGCPRAP
jgi:2-polyprenyl-6-methoxyphenol hydroxylase-like FAD-dependent oxidoreductase